MCNKIPYKTKEEAMTDAKLQKAASKHFSNNEASKVRQKAQAVLLSILFQLALNNSKNQK